MSEIFQPRLDALPREQIALWPRLRPTRDLGFVLYGGTAIALRVGHRQSVDFDFFSSGDLDKGGLRHALPFLEDSEVLKDEKNTLTVLTRQGVKVSFFGGLRFGRYGNTSVTADSVMAVASLEDLLALKIKALFDRSEAKDYLDIAAILRAGVPLEKGVAIAEQMFFPQLSPIIALKALTYFEGGDLHLLPAGERETLIDAASNFGRLPTVTRLSEEIAPETGQSLRA